jgi:CRISPR system Cascade subunit CasA
MASFNLIDAPWIPCNARAGPRVLGIRDTLMQSEELAGIADPSPLVTLALHRLLLAIVHRVYGPRNHEAWGEIWGRGAWDPEPLQVYLDERHARFDLFDGTHPFYQAVDLVVTETDLAAYKLVLELSPSNSRLFSHTDDADPPEMSPAEAARALVAFQSFHAGGLVRKRFGAGPTSGRAGPLAGSAVCLLEGKTLFETLALNMVRYAPGGTMPFPISGTDCPAWERDTSPDDEQRRPRGYLDWLTRQSRSVHLAADERAGETVVRRCVIAKGNGLPLGESENQFEQMVAFRARKDARPGQEPWAPVALRRERAVWRDSFALLHSAERSSPVSVLSEVSTRMELGYLDRRSTHPLSVCGVAYEQANAMFWRAEHLPLPLAYLDDEDLFGGLQTALRLAEAVAETLRRAAAVLAAYVLNIDLGGRLDRSRQQALGRRRDAMGAERRYWASLDSSFSRFVVDQPRVGRGSLADWGDQMMRSARVAYETVAEGLGTDGDVLRVEVQGRARLERGLARARREHPFEDSIREEAS